MMVEHLEQEGTPHNSRDLLKIFEKMGDQLVSTGFQTGWCHTVWTWCLSSLVLSEDLAHIFFTDLKCRSGGGGLQEVLALCREMVRMGVGGFKSTIKLIQVFSKLLIHLSAGGWCLVVGDGFQTFPH